MVAGRVQLPPGALRTIQRGDIVYVSEWLVGAICGSLVTAVALMAASLAMGPRKGK